MKNLKFWIIIGIVGILIISTISSYNGMVTAEQGVEEQWANVQTQYQRRADLFMNLVKTVKGSAEFESKVLREVTQARAGITSAKSPEDLELMGRKINTAINLAYEAYPQLKTADAFKELQAQVEGTENRIAIARKDYNEIVKSFNSKIKTFPGNMMASMFGFTAKKYFEAAAGTEKAPEIQF